MRLVAHVLFFTGAIVFVGSLLLPWEGMMRIFRDGRREETTFTAFFAAEEAKVAAGMGIAIIGLSLGLAWSRRGIVAISLIEMLLLIGLIVLICIHARNALSFFFSAPNYSAEGIRVVGPYVGLGACAVMFVSRIFKLLGRERIPPR